ncbi:hypothetical protein CIW48_27480 [Methylobacterium sp. P1-11]|uniref:hypothetical protein n=1 Tax=Methylobacterium sp. P1-11 TaxID=2024616 RepID=UPI0011F024B0|nr:hypothetical protein [Methylobacterium sp. P1-11]KAA0116677.1 hypothetical protein CIW48_27480 [Methylobacterium sp. P1-11]
MTLAAVLIVVPTTGGPLVVRSLKVRPGLPASAAFAQGDYRPLPWSGDYARLAAPGGPLSSLTGATAAHELRLSGSFDAGRSWEVPVCLAHGLLARGHRLVAEPGEADLILWATGAVDLDLAVLPGDYALRDKIERSRALLDAAPQTPRAVLLPEGPERAEALLTVQALGAPGALRLLPATTVAAALETLAAREAADAGSAIPVPRRRRGPAVAAGALALGLAGVALGAVYARPPTAEAPATAAAGPEPRPGQLGGRAAAPSSATVGVTAASAPAAAPVIRVDELVAPARSSCRRVAFGADPPERRPVPEEAEGRLRPTRLAPELCGLAFRSALPGSRIEVGPELRAASLPPSALNDGAQAYFLREGARQNFVYAVQAVPEAGAARRITHALERPTERRIERP